MNLYEYKGNIHIHTNLSDGGKDIYEILKCAGKKGLDFICINDHDFMIERVPLEKEGFLNGVLLLIGLEIGRRYNHYLAFNIREIIKSDGLSPQGVIDRVNEQGGFGFLAHPFEKGMPLFEKSIAYTWNDFSVYGYTGICIWNFMSRWKERVKDPIHGFIVLMFKSQMLKGPSRETLRFWDSLCLKRKTVAIGGSDAHGTLYRVGLIKFRPFTYDFLLNSINIHVLLEDKLSDRFSDAKTHIYGAMKDGRLFISNDSIHLGDGFNFYYQTMKGKKVFMGDATAFDKGLIYVELPTYGYIRIIRNGELFDTSMGMEYKKFINQRGIYRVEVYKRIPVFGLRPWIFSNPIYIGYHDK